MGIAVSLTCLGALALGRKSQVAETMRPETLDQVERAATLFGAVDRLLESTPSVLAKDDRQLYDQSLAAVRSLVDEEAFERAWAEGKAMSIEQSIAFALELDG